MSLNADLSDLFARMAALLEIKGENRFKAIAFQKVSRILKDGNFDVQQACREGTLKDIDGIGDSSRKIIEEYVKTGESADYDSLAGSVPAGLIPMLQIPGLGPKTIALLWKERKITSVEELAKAIDEGKLAGLKGIADKKIESIKQGLALRAAASGRVGIVEAAAVAEELLRQVKEIKWVKEAEIAGSLRRRKETIGDVDLLCALGDDSKGQEVSDQFVKFPQVARILGQGVTKASILTTGNLQVDLRIVPAENFGAALLYFTGSKDHNVALRGLAQEKEMTLNEWGLYKVSEYDKANKKPGHPPTARPVASRTEADVYRALGMPLIDPLLREDRGEIDAARAGKLPSLIQLSDIRGDLHCHTTASDGRNSIAEMAQAAAELGYEFLAITDHSKSSVIANGLTAERLLKHVKEIHRVSSTLKGITLLAGCEVDILADGHLDFEDAVLAELDIVIASPHIALKQETAKATDRLLRAIENRYVNVIGHPTGRLIFGREGLPLDLPRIYRAAADSGTALEINAAFPRLDLNDVHSRAAVAAGAMLSINTDAHATDGLKSMLFGLDVARRAWAEKRNVINCMSLKQLQSFIARKRG